MDRMISPLVLISVLHFQIASSTYDCVKHCSCIKENGILTADCQGLNFTEVPSPDPEYMVNVLLLQFNLVTTLRAVDFFLYTELKELSLQGNRIDTIEENAFDRLESLEKLDLSKNMISSVPGDSLTRLAGSVRWISLSMNALRRMPNGLRNMTRLEHLDVSRNGFISELNAETLPTSLIELDLHSTGIKYFKKSAFGNLTNLGTLLLNDNSASALVKFEQGVFDDLQALEYIDLSRTFCKKLQPESFTKLRKLKTLLMNKCWLSQPPLLAKVDSMDQEATGSGNDISEAFDLTVTPSSSTSGTQEPMSTVNPAHEKWFNPELTVLDLSNNGRMTLDPKSTQFSPSLLDLRLGHTNIPAINDELFKDSLSIQKLDLSFASLKRVTPNAFSKFLNATEFRLSGNPLRDVPHLPSSLLSVDLGETKMENLTGKAFANLNKVVTMSFALGEVGWIEGDAFVNMTSLQTLDLSENKLDILQQNTLAIGKTHLRNISELLELDLSSNVLRLIENGAFSTHRRLRVLDLQSNFLSSVQPGLFQGLDNLVKLNLSLNSIVDITPHALRSLTNLEELDLEDNDLEVLFEGTFSGMRSLLHLYLKKNALSLIHPIDLPSLVYVDMAANNLTTLPQIRGGNLLELRASNNPLKEIKSGVFSGAPKLENVDLSYCGLAWTDYSVFAEAQSLKVLDLTENNIQTFVNVSMPSLENLVLKNNNIQTVSVALNHVAPVLKTLALGYNNISYLDPDVFSGSPGLSRVDLYHNGFQCNCDLSPLVQWMKSHIWIFENAEYYKCVGPAEHGGSLVLKTVSGLNCTPSKGSTSNVQIYVPIAVAIAVLAVVLIFLVCFVVRKSRREREGLRMLRNGTYRDETLEIGMASDSGCCVTCLTWGRGSNAYRRRADTEERRDLMISSPVTSPSQKEAPASLE